MLLGAFSERRAGALHWASSRGNSLTFREDPAFSAGSGWRPSQRRPSGAGSTPAKSTTRRSGERAALQSGALPQEPKDGAQQKEPLRLVWRCVAGAIVCCLLESLRGGRPAKVACVVVEGTVVLERNRFRVRRRA